MDPSPNQTNVAAPLAPQYRNALRTAAIELGCVLFLAALVLDGGRVFRLSCIAAISYLVMFVMIALRRPAAATDLDLILVRHGVLILLAATLAIAAILS